jgi:hypothetical protein
LRGTWFTGAALFLFLLVGGGWYALSFVSEENPDSQNTRPAKSPDGESAELQSGEHDWEALRRKLPMTPKQALIYANDLRSKEPDVWVTLTTEAIEFRYPDGEQVNIPLGNDEVAIAVAPYRMSTHPCSEHSVTGCSGELAKMEFSVMVTDAEGSVVLSETISTGDNGFFELWLPRDQTLELVVSSSLGTARRDVSTYIDSPTCITDMQLN